MKIVYVFFLSFFFSSTVYSNSLEENNEEASQAIVFMYHHFGEDRFPSTNIRLEQFQKQLDYLQEHRYKVWPLSKVLYYIKNKRTLPKKVVSLTIDDAYISTYKHAYPMLKAKNFPYTVFVNTRAIGSKSIMYMTWDHMREMKCYGAEFSNHSHTHSYLIPSKYETQEEWKNRIRLEIENAQEKLQSELGSSTNENPKMISYPFGEYTPDTANYIKELGYIGVTQTSGVLSNYTDLRRVPRFAMAEAFAHMEGFSLKLHTLAFPIKKAEPWNPVIQRNPPVLKLALHKPLKYLGCYTSNGKKIDMRWMSPTELEIQAPKALVGERDRYTCTTLDKQRKGYLWYSHLWILND